MQKQLIAAHLNDLKQIALELLPLIKERKKIAFEGEIGAGKTTFIKILCQLLGVKTNTSSPTFAIINEYPIPNDTIHHIDLYRLKSEDEAYSIGLMELLEGHSYCFVEWPNIAKDFFPESTIWIKITAQLSEERIFDILY